MSENRCITPTSYRYYWGGDEMAGRLYLSRVRLNSGGYTDRGRYFGTGQTLWRASDDDGSECYIRASTRAGAKLELPGFAFYR